MVQRRLEHMRLAAVAASEDRSVATKRDIGATIRVRGIVQGVGFRPFVYHLAQRHRLRGTVRNDAGDVVIEVVGASEAIERFTLALRSEAPPAAAVEEVSLSLIHI